jgi:hypothetical protein
MSNRAEQRFERFTETISPASHTIAQAYARLVLEVASTPGFQDLLAREGGRIDQELRERARRQVERRELARAPGMAPRGPVDELHRAQQPEASGRQVALWRAVAEYRLKAPKVGVAQDARAVPIITQLTRTDLSPGDVIGIYGDDLGEQATIVTDDPDGPVKIPLQVLHTETVDSPNGPSVVYLEAMVPPDLSGVRGKQDSVIWTNRSDGAFSNYLPIRFEPAHEYYYAVFDADLKSSFGYPGVRDGVAAEGSFLADWGHRVDVTLIHKGDGWSELRAPFADGQSLAQGFHIGNAWFEYSRIRIFYEVTSARGIPGPVQSPGLSEWTGPSEIPWVPWF